MPTCSKCKVEKETGDFHRRGDGLFPWCKVCKSAYVKEKRVSRSVEQVEKEKSRMKRGYEKNIASRAEYNKAYRKLNAEKISSRMAEYYKTNSHLWTEYRKKNLAEDSERSMRRWVKKVSATPTWANEEKIMEIYDLASEFRAAGFDVHVDHILPLQGKIVSGLHVEQNLRVCLASVNRSKGNRYMEYHE
jgi:hypothetical protein